MSAVKSIARKRCSESVLTKSDLKHRVVYDFDPDLSSDLKGIMTALQQIKEKAQKDGQNKNEETISRKSFTRALSKSTKECESCLKNETAKFQYVYDKFSKERASHLQVFKDTISKFEEEKERLFMRYEQLSKKEKSLISEQEKYCTDRISKLEESLKKKQDDKTFSFLRKTLGSFLDNASDEEFLLDD